MRGGMFEIVLDLSKTYLTLDSGEIICRRSGSFFCVYGAIMCLT